MSWFVPPTGAPFGVEELPYGVFCGERSAPRIGVALGDQVIDLAGLARTVGRQEPHFDRPCLNDFLALGPAVWAEHRGWLLSLLSNAAGEAVLSPHLVPMGEVTMRMPIEVADYVDFYASEHHATNVGRMFRPDGEPLTPNWKHLPIGYHGRAGTVVVSGTEVIRPHGQRKASHDPAPVFGPSIKLDIEAELGWVVGVRSEPGQPVPVENFRDHVFGVVILNDWSARDLQAWEYVPLGPFLGKSFATSISAWVLPLAALSAAEASPQDHQPVLLPYLRGQSSGYAIDVEVELNGTVISRCPYATMYYTPAQMLAHLTVNGAHLRTGDLFGSGTISGPDDDQRGSLLELSWNGAEPITVGADRRTFLEDGDQVVMRATAAGLRLGEVVGRITPAR
jgi:fumarylacetoacetase